MKPSSRVAVVASLLVAGLWAAASVAQADDSPEVGPNTAAQSAADVLRSYAGADVSFIHAGFFKGTVNRDDLSTFLSYPTDGIAVLQLSGDQIREALEFAVSLYPEPNYSFLQISGLEVTFKKGAPADHRITAVSVGGSPLEGSRKYSVAMPSLLAQGAVGYLRYWGKEKSLKDFGSTTLEDILKGKRASDSSPRWVVQS